jgi:hypothetical protein
MLLTSAGGLRVAFTAPGGGCSSRVRQSLVALPT